MKTSATVTAELGALLQQAFREHGHRFNWVLAIYDTDQLQDPGFIHCETVGNVR